jgi:phage gp45-like
MHGLLDALRVQAAKLDRTLGQPRFGTISSFNSANYTARVLLQPEGTVTGWLPVLSAWTGAGWGIVCPLTAGDQVFVLSQEGDAEHGVIVGCAFSNRTPPPRVATDEFWIVHKSGASLKLKTDGTVAIAGDLHVDGDVFDRHGSLAHLRSIYNAHRHNTASGAVTSQPNITD